MIDAADAVIIFIAIVYIIVDVVISQLLEPQSVQQFPTAGYCLV